MNQDPVPLPKAAHDHQHRIRGSVADTEGRTLVETEMVRHRHDIPCPGGREFRLTAKLRPCHHSLADDQPADTRADGFDLAGDLVAQDARPFRRGRIQADSRYGVGEVDAGCPHGDPYLTRSDRWIGPVLDLEHVRPASTGQDHCLHYRESTRGASPMTRRRSSSLAVAR